MKIPVELNSIKSIQIFQLFRFASVFITGVILAQKGFSTNEISEYETFLFITYAASFFWLSGVTNSFIATFPKTNPEERGVLIFNTSMLLFSFSIVSSFITGALFITGCVQSSFSHLVVIYIVVSIPSYINEYILLVFERNKQLIAYGAVSFLLHISIIIAVITLNFEIKSVVLGLIIISGVKFLYLILLLFRYSTFQLNINQIKLLGISTIPLAISYLLSGSAELIDGFLVKNYFDKGEFAIFRFGARELPLVLLLSNAFSSAAIPKIAENLEMGLELIRKNSLQLFNFFFPVTVLLMFFSSKLFVIVFSPEFAKSAFIFNVYLLLIISRLLFPQTILNGFGKNRFLAISALAEVVVNVSSSILLMKIFGLTGIAIGTVIANLFDKLLLIGYCKYRLKIEPEKYISVFQHVFFSFMLLVIAYLLSL